MDDARALELWVEMAGRIFTTRTGNGGWGHDSNGTEYRCLQAKRAAEDARLVFEAVEEISGHKLITKKEVTP